jgi:DMSO/TMAO reductase YedYZ molybdopterin-dependent catalytic subunit
MTAVSPQKRDFSMRPYFRFLMLFTAVLLPLRFAPAQDAVSTLSIRGDVQKPTQWSMEALKAQFAGQTQSVKFMVGKDKEPKVGTGIPLLSVIQAVALRTDQSIKHHDLKFLVILEAKDSYQAFFSLAELTPPQGGPDLAFLIWDVDVQRLSEKEAPLRLILTTDGEARQIHGVTTITLVDGVKLAKQLKEKG